jgi:hypothetical protein
MAYSYAAFSGSCAAFSCSGPRHDKLPTAEPRPKTPTPNAEAVSQRRQLLRLGAAGLLGRALFGAVFALHGPDAPEPIRILPAVVRADPWPPSSPDAGSSASKSKRHHMSVSRARTPTDDDQGSPSVK